MFERTLQVKKADRYQDWLEIVLIPIPPYFQVSKITDKSINKVLSEASQALDLNVGCLPRHRTEAFIEAVFSSMFELFPRRTVLLARNFKPIELSSGAVLYWNTELKGGVIDAAPHDGWIDQAGKWERPAVAGLERHLVLPVTR